MIAFNLKPILDDFWMKSFALKGISLQWASASGTFVPLELENFHRASKKSRTLGKNIFL